LNAYSGRGGRCDQAHEFAVLERAEGGAEIVTAQTADLSEEGLVELLADHRGGLQQMLGLLVEPIDARGPGATAPSPEERGYRPAPSGDKRRAPR